MFFAVLFLERSDAKNVQLKDDIKNDHAKGNKDAFPKTVPLAMQLMAEFRPVKTASPVPPPQGTSFIQADNKKSGRTGRVSAEEWSKLTPAKRTRLVQS